MSIPLTKEIKRYLVMLDTVSSFFNGLADDRKPFLDTQYNQDTSDLSTIASSLNESNLMLNDLFEDAS
jgi:hypothetical protein